MNSTICCTQKYSTFLEVTNTRFCFQMASTTASIQYECVSLHEEENAEEVQTTRISVSFLNYQ